MKEEFNWEAYNADPISYIKGLEFNWDGYYSEPISDVVIQRAEELLKEIKLHTTILPTLHPTSTGAIDFNYTESYPDKELTLSIEDTENFTCEYLLSIKDDEIEGECFSISAVIEIIKDYLER
jgi:hypothetical protein